jgi:hypothetical protein
MPDPLPVERDKHLVGIVNEEDVCRCSPDEACKHRAEVGETIGREISGSCKKIGERLQLSG